MTYELAYEIPFTSDLHKRVLNAVVSRKKLAGQSQSSLQPMWNRSDEAFRAYTPDRVEDIEARLRRKKGEPEFVKLTIPYSTALLLTAHTYWTSVFLSRSPVLQFRAYTGEAEQNVLAVEALLDYQLNVGEQLVPLYVWLMDVGRYGRGIVGNYWCAEQSSVARMEDVQVTTPGGIPVEDKTKRTLIRERVAGYEGNKVYNIRPHDFYPDPRVPLPRFQDGEFCGVKMRVTWNTIAKGAAQGRYFNTQELRNSVTGGTEGWVGGSRDQIFPDSQTLDEVGETSATKGRKGFIDLDEQIIELSPSAWGLGGTEASSYPEKWVFTVANETVVIGARPLGCYHNKFPYSVMEYEVDGYTLSPRSMLELLEPLNQSVSWLMNTHMFNVRQILNGSIIYDPSRLVAADISRKGEGRVIRLAPAAYGTDPASTIHQLQTMDVTQTNLRDMQVLEEIMQRLVGVSDNVMGMLAPGGRKTATEVRSSSSLAANRLKTNCEYMSAMGFQPLARMLLANSQQYYSAEKKLRVAGDQMQGPKFIQVSPEDIQGELDYVSVDGTMPIDRFAQATLWKELLAGLVQAGLAGSPPSAQNPAGSPAQYDVAGIFAWIAHLAGMNNITNFRIKVDVQPPGAGAPAGQSLLPGGGNPNVTQLPTGLTRSPIALGNVGNAGAAG